MEKYQTVLSLGFIMIFQAQENLGFHYTEILGGLYYQNIGFKLLTKPRILLGQHLILQRKKQLWIFFKNVALIYSPLLKISLFIT